MADEATGKVTPEAGGDAEKPPADGVQPKAEGTPKPAAKADAATGKEGDAATSAGGKDGTAQPEPKAPDTYELKVPDGAEGYIEDSDIEQIQAIAKAKGWTNEQAQEALEEHADRVAEQSAAFRKEVDNDPVYGGKNIEQTQLHAKRALDRMWPAESEEHKALSKMLTKTGWGNHRLIVGGLANIGKLMQEDSPGDQRTQSGGAKRSAEEVLYGVKG